MRTTLWRDLASRASTSASDNTSYGGAITGALTMATGVTLRAPHGGIFVFFAIGNLAWFVIATVIGAVAGALAVIAAKQFARPSVKVDETPVLATA